MARSARHPTPRGLVALGPGAVVLATALLVVVTGAGIGIASASAQPIRPVGVLVHGAAVALRPATMAQASGLPISSVRILGPRVALVRTRTADVQRAAARLARVPGVTAASPDRRVTIAGARSPLTPASTGFAHQWDLWDASSTARAGGWGVDASRAWTRTKGSSAVVVAVLDTGWTDHPDLAGAAVAPGYDFVSGGDGVDPVDGDGWDDDPTDPGDACAASGEPSSWHGTFVASEIAAQHRRGSALAGAAPGVTVEPVRVLGACGGSESDTVAAIEWASGGTVPGVPANARPADVVSMSLGGADGACSAALQTAIDSARSRGTVVVAAAGNDGRPVAGVSPANCRGVISVVATTRSGTLAGYSNRGSAAGAPTLAAPGGSSSAPVLGAGWSGAGRPIFVGAVGTSMAAPRVAAAAALVLSGAPGLPPDDVAQRLVASATPFPARGGCSAAVCGAGIVNLGSAVGAPARLVLVDRVTVRGRARAGAVLSVHPGRWRPGATATTYRWLRDGHQIAGATRPTLRLRARDAGHRIAVRVMAQRAGAVHAAAVSAARRIAR